MVRGLRFFAACGVVLAACAVSGCINIYDPSLVHGTTGGCGIEPPARPDIADSSEPGDVVFGLRDVVLNLGDMWRTTGYDLDCRVTTGTNATTECMPRMAAVPVDGVDGIDNQFGAALFPLVDTVIPGLETRSRMAQLEGRGLPILRARGWNGTRNDPVVDITVTAAVFSTAFAGDTPPAVVIHGPDDVTLMDGSPLPPPAWDGNDWTWVRDDSFLGGDPEQPFVRDEQAYVVDGVVVAHLPARVEIVLPTDTVGVLVRLTDGYATARLSDDMLHLENVVVAGRWSITDLLSTAENIGLCRGMTEYTILESQLHRIADLRSIPPAMGDPILECDALSIGVQFTGFRMRIAGVTPGLPILNLCLAGDGGVGDDAGMMSVDSGAMGDAGMGVDAAVSADAGHDAGVDAGMRDGG